MDSVQGLNLLFMPLKVSIEHNAVCFMVCSIITDDNRVPSEIVFLACANGIAST